MDLAMHRRLLTHSDHAMLRTQRTHKDFKSIDPRVRDAEMMNDFLFLPLYYQNMFYKMTTPGEKRIWGVYELSGFRINLEEVDRLYYIYSGSNYISSDFRRGLNWDFCMVGRMDHNRGSLYIFLTASCDDFGFMWAWNSRIFISGDADLFMKVVATSELRLKCIYQSLTEDGIPFHQVTEYLMGPRRNWKDVPTLKYLCYEAVFDNMTSLRDSYRTLPRILKDDVDDFITTKDLINQVRMGSPGSTVT